MTPFVTRDLDLDSCDIEIETDVCVIGAGPVGLTVARALAENGRRVTILERGGATPAQPTGNDMIVFDRRSYRGATAGRAMGAGGTSALWGGQLLPVREIDLPARPPIGAPAWPIIFADLEPHFATLERWLEVTAGSFDTPYSASIQHPLGGLQWNEWRPRYSKWTPFGRRNVYRAFENGMSNSVPIRLFLNAKVGNWIHRRVGGRVTVDEIQACSTGGRELRVGAKVFVICAGALESARLVLELGEAVGGLGDGPRRFAGRFLHDHLSVRIGKIDIADRSAFQTLFAPVFAGATMRSLRMELDGQYMADAELPALYAHFVAEADPGSAFAVLRDALRGMQKGALMQSLVNFRRIPSALPGIAEILFERLVRRRLPFPRGAGIYLHCDIEQAPVHENRIYLGAKVPDGDRPMHIDWDVDDDVNRVGTIVQGVFRRFWQHNGLDRVARVEMFELAQNKANMLNNLYDIYHPAGTTRMSSDPELGVVDPNLLVHGATNTFIAGSAVFPSMGAANPTFTAMALGLRLGETINRRLKPA